MEFVRKVSKPCKFHSFRVTAHGTCVYNEALQAQSLDSRAERKMLGSASFSAAEQGVPGRA
jgi:hypothetical protein